MSAQISTKWDMQCPFGALGGLTTDSRGATTNTPVPTRSFARNLSSEYILGHCPERTCQKNWDKPKGILRTRFS